MRFLVTGAGGQLGADVMAELAASGFDAVGTDLARREIGRASCRERV